jgi:hypothetical protein
LYQATKCNYVRTKVDPYVRVANEIIHHRDPEVYPSVVNSQILDVPLGKVDEQFVFVSIFEVVAECQILYGVPDLGGIVALFFALFIDHWFGAMVQTKMHQPQSLHRTFPVIGRLLVYQNHLASNLAQCVRHLRPSEQFFGRECEHTCRDGVLAKIAVGFQIARVGA